MNSPADFLRVSTLVFLMGLALIVLYRALAGGHRLRGLLDGTDVAAQGALVFSPARAQLLAVAGLSALGFLTWGMSAQDQTSGLTVVILIALTASNLIYLRSKFLQLGSPLGRSRR